MARVSWATTNLKEAGWQISGLTHRNHIRLLAKSERAAKRLLESCTNYLEGKLKLTVNKDKSRVVKSDSIQNASYPLRLVKTLQSNYNLME